MLLQSFNKGLNNVKSPNLLSTSESVICDNVDISKGALIPLNIDITDNTIVLNSIINYKNSWVTDLDTYYVIYREILYKAKPDKLYKYDGVNEYTVGIEAPTSAPTYTTGAGNLTGTYRYCYTYYNSADGTESEPSPYTGDIVLSSNNVTLTFISSTNAQTDSIRIYRIGGNISVMSLVDTIPNTTTSYTDNIADNAIDGLILASSTNGMPPAGIKYLTLHNAMLFGAVGDKLYFSKIGQPNAWSEFDFIDFDYNITGMGVTPNGLVVFTENTSHIILGNTADTFSKFLLSDKIGCIEHRTVKSMSNVLVWLSTSGICISSGSSINTISRDAIDFNTFGTPKCAEVIDDIYYLAFSDKMLVFDNRFGRTFYTIDLIAEALAVYNGKLWFNSVGLLYQFNAGTTKRTMHYKSPVLIEGYYSMVKYYNTIYVYSIGQLEFKVYIDNTLVLTYQLTDGGNEIKLPQINKLGYSIQFEVTGTGSLYEIEYKVEGRQNGR